MMEDLVSREKPVALPEGDRGSFLITRHMLEEFEGDLSFLETLVQERAKELGIPMVLHAVHLWGGGVLVSWEPE